MNSVCFFCRRIVYADELKSGPQCVRPFNLAWRSDFGLAYICEPEELVFLAQLILSSGPLGYVSPDLLVEL